MDSIPLEDSFSDVVGKAQRGLKLADQDLANNAGISIDALAQIKAGNISEPALQKLAPVLNLKATALISLAKKEYAPAAQELEGLASFNTTYEDMTVNSYLVFDPTSRVAAVFDTGADSTPMTDFAKAKGLKIQWILLTHTHPDHIADLQRLLERTKAPAYVCELEKASGAEPFREGKTFPLGSLNISTRQTSGHARGGITYVVEGLRRPVAIVGDALFAGSMGGGLVSYSDALQSNRLHIFGLPDDTIVCPGHGPLTTVGEEKKNNPFYPEFNR